MDNSIYIAVSRQSGLFRDMEVSANNLANINTTGYNAQKLLFSEYLVRDGSVKDAYANDPSTYRDTTNGPVKMTGNPFDLAIAGPGYFQVETPLGRRYTKSGNFQVDANGTLMTPTGYPVLGADGGQITIPDDARSVEINSIGQVIVDGAEAGQVGIVEFANEQELKRLGNNLFSSEQAALPAASARVMQGALEGSNVNAVTELVRVMQLSRSVDSSAKFIESAYDLQRKTSKTYSGSQN